MKIFEEIDLAFNRLVAQLLQVVGLVRACVSIPISVKRHTTVANAESNTNFTSSNSATIALYAGGSVNVDVGALVQGAINGSGNFALYSIESEELSLTTRCAASDTNIAHVNHTKV